MRTTTATLVLAAALLGLGAAPRPAHAEQKIAYVDLQRALNEIDEGKAAKARLKSEFEQKQKIIDEKKTEFDKLRGDFEKQAVVMSEEARREKQGELEKKGMELQGYFVQLQKELSEREREATRGIFDKMHSVVKEIADAEGIALVTQAEALVYAAPSLDITNELVRRYNARFKVTPAAAPAKATDKKPKAESAGDKKAKKETK